MRLGPKSTLARPFPNYLWSLFQNEEGKIEEGKTGKLNKKRTQSYMHLISICMLLLLNINININIQYFWGRGYVLFQIEVRGVITFFSFNDQGLKNLFGIDN